MEMKKEWVKPETKVQMFVPNEYCVVCDVYTPSVEYYRMDMYNASIAEGGVKYNELTSANQVRIAQPGEKVVVVYRTATIDAILGQIFGGFLDYWSVDDENWELVTVSTGNTYLNLS